MINFVIGYCVGSVITFLAIGFFLGANKNK